MKVSIRSNVFETNSSSVHTLAIVKNAILKLPTPGSTLEVNCNGEFGWENEVYTDVDSKLSYLWKALEDSVYDSNVTIDEQVEALKDKVAKLKSYLTEIGVNLVIEYDTIKKVESSCTPGYFYVQCLNADEKASTGYIDHGCEAKAFVEYVLSSSDNLFRFLFDERSYIITGNDNDDYYCDAPNNESADFFEKGN